MTTLSEQESKVLLAQAGVPFAPQIMVTSPEEAGAAGSRLGFPLVAKLNGAGIAHKTERGLVKLGLESASAVEQATRQLLDAAVPEDGEVSVLLAPQLSTSRELLAGVTTDPQFGPAVVLGVGGVLTEVLGQVTIRLAPLSEADAHAMVEDFPVPALLEDFRGEAAVDRPALVGLLMALSDVVVEGREVISDTRAGSSVVAVDLNPILIKNGLPVAVDALVEVG